MIGASRNFHEGSEPIGTYLGSLTNYKSSCGPAWLQNSRRAPLGSACCLLLWALMGTRHVRVPFTLTNTGHCARQHFRDC